MRRQSVLLDQASQNNVWQQSVGENQLPHIYLSIAYNELIICIMAVVTVFISCWELKFQKPLFSNPLMFKRF